MQTKPVKILLVEDNPGDVFLTKKALEKSKIANSLVVATDGLESLNILRKEADHFEAVTPDIILLDLNLPRMTGHELL
ncbi:MAG: response regulator [Lentisphaeraceae bacterium]|nr:response regulator [Lentisphaeraceae bacterium]